MQSDATGESSIVEKTTFKFSNNNVTFEKQVNGEKDDASVNHPVDETQLSVELDESWTEALFYGRGNAAM